jgi:hypothetical protein
VLTFACEQAVSCMVSTFGITSRSSSQKAGMKEGRDSSALARIKTEDDESYDFARRPWTKEVISN